MRELWYRTYTAQQGCTNVDPAGCLQTVRHAEVGRYASANRFAGMGRRLLSDELTVGRELEAADVNSRCCYLIYSSPENVNSIDKFTRKTTAYEIFPLGSFKSRCMSLRIAVELP